MFPTAERGGGRRSARRPAPIGWGGPAGPPPAPAALTEDGAQGAVHGGVPHRQPRHPAAAARASPPLPVRHPKPSPRFRPGLAAASGPSPQAVPPLPGDGAAGKAFRGETGACAPRSVGAGRAGDRAGGAWPWGALPGGLRGAAGRASRPPHPGTPSPQAPRPRGLARWRPRTPPSPRWPRSRGSPSA